MTMRSILMLAVLAGSACDPGSERCDEDQRYSHGLCYEIDPADAGATSGSSFAHFADICAEPTGCAAPTDYCLRKPADQTGYCTRTGCLADLARCPAIWTCVALAVSQPGEPGVCVKP
jgi:hypothetical protein